MSVKQTLTTLMMTLACVALGNLAHAADMPDQVSLDSMVKLFDGVEFDHAMHIDLGEDCSVCHHHTTGTGTTDERCVSCHAESEAAATVSCRSCHVENPFSADHINLVSSNVYLFHIDKPGLKAAYHWNCVSCHEQMDGPTGCQDCHSRTPEGDAFYHEDATGSSVAETSGHE
jgi:hypothetical protein